MKKLIPLLALTAMCSSSSIGQVVKSVSASIYNASTAFPFTRFLPMHPGFEVGATFLEIRKDKFLQNVNAKAGFYYHRRVENAIYLRGEYMVRPIIAKVMTFDFLIDLGYMHTFYPGEVYALDDEGEAYKVKQAGRPHFMGSLGIGATLTKYRVEPFIRQEMVVVTPFASGIPVMVHSFLKIGINIKIGKNEE